MTGFNLGCVDEVKVEDLKEVANFDGLNPVSYTHLTLPTTFGV